MGKGIFEAPGLASAMPGNMIAQHLAQKNGDVCFTLTFILFSLSNNLIPVPRFCSV